MTTWIPVSERLPVVTKGRPYPQADVILQCRANGWQRRHANAVLRFIGGDPGRPYWCEEKSAPPLENDSWYVTHWADIPEFPDAVTDPASPYELAAAPSPEPRS